MPDVKASDEEKDLYLINSDSNHSEAWHKKEFESIQAYNAIIQAFSDRRGPAPADGKFHSKADGELYASDFPDYYGGSYINKNADLVVMIAGTVGQERKAEGKTFIQSICGSTSILFREVRLSYTELLNGLSRLYRYYYEKGHIEECSFTISGFGIGEDRNAIDVYIDTRDESVLNEVLEVVQIADAVNFHFEDAQCVPTASANCGTAIGTNNAVMTFSLGYPAKYTSSGGSVISGL